MATLDPRLREHFEPIAKISEEWRRIHEKQPEPWNIKPEQWAELEQKLCEDAARIQAAQGAASRTINEIDPDFKEPSLDTFRDPVRSTHLLGNRMTYFVGEAGTFAEDPKTINKDSVRHPWIALRHCVTAWRAFLKHVGYYKPAPRNINLGKLAKTVLEAFELEAKSLNVKLRLEENSTKTFADRDMAYASMYNLIRNAIRKRQYGFDYWIHGCYNPDKTLTEIKVSVRKRGNRAEVIVSDDGQPIPRPETIFARDLKKIAAGTGTGLPTTQQIVKRFGGKTTAINTPKGPVFTLHLPLAKAA